MATGAQISVEEYLRTSWEPDRDYLDGEVVERNVGENPDSEVQINLTGFFLELRKTQPVHPRTEIRMRVAERRFRVADLAVFASRPAENVPSTSPLVVIEIVSREDRHIDIIQKLEEYRNWGVEHVWLADPWLWKLYVYTAAGLTEVPAFELPEFNARIAASEVFA